MTENKNRVDNTNNKTNPIEEKETAAESTGIKQTHHRTHCGLGQPIIINGNVQEFVNRLKKSPDCWTMPKPKGQDQLIRKLTSGRR